MKRPSPIYFLLKSEQERAEFLEAGVDLPRGKMMDGGEFIRFEIAEDDPRWQRIRDCQIDNLDKVVVKNTSQQASSIKLSLTYVPAVDNCSRRGTPE